MFGFFQESEKSITAQYLNDPHHKGSVKGFKRVKLYSRGSIESQVFFSFSSLDMGLGFSGVSVCNCVCVCPHWWAGHSGQVKLSNIMLHSLSLGVEALSLGGHPQGQPIRALRQWDGRAALLSAGLMPTKVQRCRHSVAQAGLNECVCVCECASK